MNDSEAIALAGLVRERVAELLRFRRWYRAHRWADWTELRRDNDAELRGLLRLLRQARRPRPDYAAWTPGELVAGFGK